MNEDIPQPLLAGLSAAQRDWILLCIEAAPLKLCDVEGYPGLKKVFWYPSPAESDCYRTPLTTDYEGPMEHLRFTKAGDLLRYERRCGPPARLIAADPATFGLPYPALNCRSCEVVSHNAVEGVGHIRPCVAHLRMLREEFPSPAGEACSQKS